MTQQEFVAAVLVRLGLTQTELGVRMGWDNAYQSAHAWLTGKSGLPYEETMRMLVECGWLHIDLTPLDQSAQAVVAQAQAQAARDLQEALKALPGEIRRGRGSRGTPPRKSDEQRQRRTG